MVGPRSNSVFARTCAEYQMLQTEIKSVRVVNRLANITVMRSCWRTETNKVLSKVHEHAEFNIHEFGRTLQTTQILPEATASDFCLVLGYLRCSTRSYGRRPCWITPQSRKAIHLHPVDAELASAVCLTYQTLLSRECEADKESF